MTVTGPPSRSASGAGARRSILSGPLAVVLIALAAIFALLYRHENSSEDHSYNAGAKPPVNVMLTAGKQYEISTPGGVKALVAQGASTTVLNCNYSPVGGASTQQLDVSALGVGTRTTHTVATFIAPVSGLVHIECRALPSTYIDDANGVGGDPAGLYILLCTIFLSVGAMVGLSVLYRRGPGPRTGRTARVDGTGEPAAPAEPAEPPFGR